MTNKPLLGQLIVNLGIVDQKTVNEALKLQTGGNRRLGYILVRMKAITSDQLAEILHQQLNIPITNIEKSFSPDVRSIMPRYLCQKYGILPLALKNNNILEVAMANPADEEAICDIEHYTQRAVKPCLARSSEIEKEISRRIPLGLKDIFSPGANIFATRLVAVITLLCVIGLSSYTFDYVRKSREGTISTTGNLTLYQNLDLTVAVDPKGKYSLQGHGAYANGLYKAEFQSIEYLDKFIKKRERDFSEKQIYWLNWVIQRIKPS